MSNSLAIAATTATLRSLLQSEVPLVDADLSDLEVTVQALDAARKGVTKAQLNLFLYQTVVNGAWRNFDVPRQTRPGEASAPPLALNLHYLVTAYGRGESDTDIVNHRVLGGAMSVLHDHPRLGRDEIAIALAGSDLERQFEALKITPLALGVEEISKLWMVFQTQYRISAAYEVTVVLIDSRVSRSAPLPVLKRGSADRGVVTAPGAAATLDSFRLPRSQAALRLGEDGALTGARLTTRDATLRFTSTRLPAPVSVTPGAGVEPGELGVRLLDVPDDPSALSRWAPGLYSVALVVTRAGSPAIVSNEVPFALAPRTTVSATSTGPGAVTVTVTSAPRLAPDQLVFLIFGDRQLDPTSVTTPADPTLPTTLMFEVSGASAGSYVVRLRVDGVDSIPVVYAGTPPLPAFDPAQMVTVT